VRWLRPTKKKEKYRPQRAGKKWGKHIENRTESAKYEREEAEREKQEKRKQDKDAVAGVDWKV